MTFTQLVGVANSYSKNTKIPSDAPKKIDLYDVLDPTSFVRIHRSTLVNVGFVREVVQAANHDAVVVLRSGERLRASRRYREAIAVRFAL